jgi:Golgi phosphoprotein 3 (GPP34)
MLLAEDLLLLLTDDTTGRLAVPGAEADAGLSGAVLAELALMGKVDLTGEADAGKPGRLVVRDPSPAGDPVLDAALEIVIAQQGKKPSAVIRPLGKNLRQILHGRLAASGVLRAEQARILGIFPAHRWPALDTSHEEQTRRQLAGALSGQADPDSRIAALIALLHALKCEHKAVDPRQCGLSRRQLRTRAEEIAKGSWASAAVSRVIEETIAAVTAAASAAAAGGG